MTNVLFMTSKAPEESFAIPNEGGDGKSLSVLSCVQNDRGDGGGDVGGSHGNCVGSSTSARPLRIAERRQLRWLVNLRALVNTLLHRHFVRREQEAQVSCAAFLFHFCCANHVWYKHLTYYMK